MWNRWSWAVFFIFLWQYLTAHGRDEPNRSYDGTPEDENSCREMLTDILETIDNGKILDSVVTDKVVVKSMLQLIGSSYYGIYDNFGLYCVLAHIFAKFPNMWNVSWMFIRHAKPVRGRMRTHRLEHALPLMSKRPAAYFESKAFMEDFIHKYWDFSRVS